MRLKQLTALLFIVLLYMNVMGVAMAAPIAVGSIDYVRGVVSAKAGSGEGRLLGKNAPIYQADSIVTGNNSFAILLFQDGTKVTVRPQSVFVINEYQFNQNSDNKAFFQLLKGGVRTVTGAINDNKTENITLTTPATTVVIRDRNTDLVMRSCEVNCEDGKFSSEQQSDVVGHIALAKGIVHIKDARGKRVTKTGEPLKAKDTILTANDGFAILVFTDKTRLTIESATELNIEEFSFPKGRPKQGNVLFNLVQGGARTLTGLIGKANPEKFKLKTLVATMGVRGTGFDTYYDNRTYVNVWQGAVTATRNGQMQDIDLNQTFSIGENGFNQLVRFPPRIQTKFRPNFRPDKVNTQKTWISVNKGKVALTGTRQKHAVRLNLAAGESAVSNQVKAAKVAKLPRSIANDSYTSLPADQVKSAPHRQLNRKLNGDGRGQNSPANDGLRQNNRQNNRPNGIDGSRENRGQRNPGGATGPRGGQPSIDFREPRGFRPPTEIRLPR